MSDNDLNRMKYVRHKNLNKVIRSIIQYILLLAAIYWIVNSLFTFKNYMPSDPATWDNTEGFIAISYFGVARSSTADHVSKKELDAQLEALKNHGYVTISQQDIINFYENGSPLPERALYLSFEDGRNDSALFTNKLLEKFNFKATMLTYANKMGNEQGKFLQPSDLLSMEKKGFWESGTNGYRLSYINIWDQYEHYHPLLTQEEFLNKTKAINYTHYLMDYIRDDYNIPLETKAEMIERISYDYEQMGNIYSKRLGKVPSMYMIMHSDTLYNGMNADVEAANDQHIKRLFDLHINREGRMYNYNYTDRYNLTRVQPAPYWRTNHLIMKLALDTGHDVTFVTGDEQAAKLWEVTDGVVEFKQDEMVLTSYPGMKAAMKLKDVDLNSNYEFQGTLAGHTSGVQVVTLLTDEDEQDTLQLRVEQQNVFVEYVYRTGVVERIFAVRGKDHDLADINLAVKLYNETLSITVNGHDLVTEEPYLAHLTKADFSLMSYSLMEENRWEDEGDYIYDGIFKNIRIHELQNDSQKELVYTNKLNVFSKIDYTIRRTYNNMIDWAINTF